MKNIIIIGPPRVGKSSLASLICKKYGFNYISGDSIRNAFMNVYPELGYNTKNTIKKIEFCKFINWIINENNIHLKRNIYYVIESTDISIENALKYFKDSIIIILGCKYISPKTLARSIKKHDTNLDWTFGYDEGQLIEIATNTVDKSKKLYEESLKNNLLYYDTSKNRNKIYNIIIDEIKDILI